MGYEHQYKQSILNMTDNGVANIQLSPLIPPSMCSTCEKCRFILYPCLNCELVLKLFTAQRLSRSDCKLTRKATYHSGGLQGSWQGSGAQCFVYATTIEVSQFKECLKQPHQVLFACWHAALTHTVVTSCLHGTSVDQSFQPVLLPN